MPAFRDYSQATRTTENALLVGNGVTVPPFSPEGTCAVRFQEGQQANAIMLIEIDCAAYSVKKTGPRPVPGAKKKASRRNK